MNPVERGHLLDVSIAPDTGERSEEIVRVRNLVIEQVLSGHVDPVGFLQAEDEWALLLTGSAALEVDGELIDLAEGDWVLLPAGTPHRVLSTAPGTNWLTVKLGPDRSP